MQKVKGLGAAVAVLFHLGAQKIKPSGLRWPRRFAQDVRIVEKPCKACAGKFFWLPAADCKL